MNCPECSSNHIRKNGIKRGKQNHICCNCGRQFIEDYEPSKTYSNEMKVECIRMYTVGGMGLAVGGTAIAITAAPVVAVGAVVGLAAYGIKKAFNW